ncbi:ATP-binding cassette domain-containing protein [Pseudactinotalea sp. HY160]|uniref:sugar ABC transporter ATP-binding protein n=1 Tax=Pseudactinotalea sp. HY160 TaxID=2654490 RepID=UPI00128B5D2A|nr:sugar ABC transporter ATP-binding protein [Pseudactinotalea sp. HY160]MPV51008.1 ATP-binding cassette domain-containing protein [Pseudactinotalea sp. HY160]
MSTNDQGLVLSGISKAYPGTQALAHVDLEIRPGEVVALLGENGAGKSTLASIVAGLTPPTTGTMTWRGRPYTPGSPREALDNGIALIHQEMRLLPDLTAAENVVIGRWPASAGGFVDHKTLNRQAAEALRRLGFRPPPTTLVRHLSVAAQQQVEIAKALMVDARLLILDEPTAALGAEETDALFTQVRALRDQGHSFVYVSHRLEEIRRIADRIVILRDGALIAEHDESHIDVDILVSQMVGRSVERLFPEMPAPTGQVVLDVQDLAGINGRFRDVSFQVHAGEVLGIAGIVGAGRTELVRAITGADRSSHGSVRVNGTALTNGSVTGALAAGVVMVPEDRRHQGIIAEATISENSMLVNFPGVTRGGWIGEEKVRSLAERVIERMGVKGRPDTSVGALSGGNQQKVVIGKWLELGPNVVVLDEPTRGIDVGARAAIYEVIRELAEKGLAVIVVSSDLDEVLGLSHRVLVLAGGEAQGLLPRAEATPKRVMTLATA